ncbi:Metabotropic GABA-B receptor subtype 3A, partial [Allomyces javanicus]
MLLVVLVSLLVTTNAPFDPRGPAGVHAAQFTIGVVLPTSHPAVGGITRKINQVIQVASTQAAALDPNNTYTFQFFDSGYTQAKGVNAMYQALANHSVALIGELWSQVSQAVALSANHYKLWQCSGASTSSALSDKSTYNYFFRTVQVTTAFSAAAASLGIEILTHQVFSPMALDISFQLKAIADAGPNIIVYTGHPDNSVEVLRQARAMGLMDSQYVWIGPDVSGLFLGVIPQGTPQTASDIANLNGLLYIYPRQNGRNAAYRALQAAYQAQLGGLVDDVAYGITFADCVTATIRGLHRLTSIYGAAAVQAGTHNATLADFLRPFEGASGDVAFDRFGDRQGVFDVMNIYQGVTSNAYAILPNMTVQAITTPTFASGTSVIPADRPALTVVYPRWSDTGVRALTAVRGVSILWFAITIVYIFVNRHQSMVKNLSFPFLASTALGCTLVLASEFFTIDVPTRFTCHAGMWVFTVGFQCVFAGAAVKAHRVYRIFDNKAMRLRGISNKALFTKVGIVMGVQTVLYAIWIGVAPRWVEVVPNKLYMSYTCKQTNDLAYMLILGVSMAYNVALLLVVVFFAYKTRHVMGGFRETSYILYSGIYYVRSVLILYGTLFTHTALVARIAYALRTRPRTGTSTASLPMVNAKSILQTNGTTGGLGHSPSINTMQSAAGILSAQFPVKHASKWLAPWRMHVVHLVRSENLLVLAPVTRGVVGHVIPLSDAQFDADMAGDVRAIRIACGNDAWVVQTDENVHAQWSAALAASACKPAANTSTLSARGVNVTSGSKLRGGA